MGSLHESGNKAPSQGKQKSVPSSKQLTPQDGTWGKTVHTFAEWLLKKINAHDTTSWAAGNASGYESGYEEGYEAGKLVLELKPSARHTDVAPGVDSNLFEHFDFPISQQLEQRIRADIREKLPEHQQPTDPQWEMILSKTPSTCVVAGAGSGKSTTMVLRLLVLKHYLKVPESKITVVTFTRDSRFDFISKVVKVFTKWEIPMDEEKGKSFVRTFHSRILDFFRWSPQLQGAKAFEFLSKDATDEDEEPENVLDIRLNVRQLDLMDRCYQNLFETDKRFRKLILALFEHGIGVGDRLNPEDPENAKRISAIKACSARDVEACQTVEALWRKAGHWPLPGITAQLNQVTLYGETFHAHGYAEDLKAYVVLGLDANEPSSIKIKDGKKQVSLSQALHMRRIFFQLFFSNRVLYFTSYADALHSLETLRGKVSGVPKFSYQVGGDIKPAPIMAAFHSCASFLENLGLDVPTATKGMNFKEGAIEAKFFEALGIFWPAFEEFLSNQSTPIFTFNKMFAMFSEHAKENFKNIPSAILDAQMVTLVDEFQDCGANTISWLRGVLGELRRRGLKFHSPEGMIFPSLMAVGDDWQSIYGWRGSSPKFFLHFKKYFPSPRTLDLKLQQNYRSQQMVIDAAESIVKDTRSGEPKHGVAAHPDVKDLHYPVQLWDKDDKQLVNLVEQHYEQGHEIMVLSRSRSTLKEAGQLLSRIKQRAKEDKHPDQIRLMTYHGSKGLEADAVFMLGDCEQLTSSDWRNQAYKLAKLEMDGEARAYDLAQGEEVMRLAYVAITRAKLHCYWFLDESKCGVKSFPKASEKIDAGQAYFSDFRK
ncbi:UvrD-helicase domain-containing protein [Pseudomonas shirazica]|uniref:UvrD-helicase domain-containing protein n=1 Tax=Pseudomonas shirazica TaxID=1940636 RepID=UPI001C2562D0|nr:UvrD-helicase domain-containing protein [Pseudomonas shirazica]